MERVQREYPSDFWVNYELGYLMEGRDDAAAVGYYRVAVAARPGAAVGHIMLGQCLARLGWRDEVVHHFMRALEISPADTWLEMILGQKLAAQCRTDETIERLRQAKAAEPDRPWVRWVFGQSLLNVGSHEEARAEWRRSLDGGPSATSTGTATPNCACSWGTRPSTAAPAGSC